MADRESLKNTAQHTATVFCVAYLFRVGTRTAIWLMDPEVLPEEKKKLKEHSEILRMNFTK